jgi:hypothetical protein
VTTETPEPEATSPDPTEPAAEGYARSYGVQGRRYAALVDEETDDDI